MSGESSDKGEIKSSWLPDIPVGKVASLYSDGNSQAEIADMFGVNQWDVSLFMRYHGVERRSLSSAQRNRHGNLEASPEMPRDVLDGFIVSDGYLNREAAKNPSFSQSFSEKNREYARVVLGILEDAGVPASLRKQERSHGVEYEVSTASLEDFRPYVRRWYPDGEKVVPRDINLTPEFITHWYLGDGQLKRDDQIVFHTNSFPLEGVEWLCDRLWSKYGIGAYAKEYDRKNQPGEYVVSVRAADSEKIIGMLSKTPGCFDHKYDYDGGHSRKKWLGKEEEYIMENYGDSDVEDIADELGRSVSSIYHKASRMGVQG